MVVLLKMRRSHFYISQTKHYHFANITSLLLKQSTGGCRDSHDACNAAGYHAGESAQNNMVAV